MSAKNVTMNSIYYHNITDKTIIGAKKRLRILAVLKKTFLIIYRKF